MYQNSGAGFAAAQAQGEALTLCMTGEIGIGVRLLVDVQAGAVLDRFTGVIGPDITQHSLQIGPALHISDTRFIGYLSHGCEPNCRLDMDRFQLVALRAIAARELLTVDYAATEDVLHTQFACHCGAATCREWITGRSDPINPAGASYLAALAPAARRA